MDWMDDQISDGPDPEDARDDEQVADEQEDATTRSDFEKRVRTMVARDAVEKLTVSAVNDHIGDISDAEVCERAAESATSPDLVSVFEDRAAAIRGDGDAEQAAQNTPADESATDGDGDADADADADVLATDPDDTATEPPEIESAADVTDDTATATEATDGGAVDAGGDDSDEADGVDVKSIAPDILTVDEAAEKDRRWTIEIWADPGMGKSHFAMSAQSPVVVLDTEGKADELAHKFRDEGDYPDPFIFQPSDYDEALDKLTKALEILDEFRREAGVIGTLVVDSMSVMWEWSQQKYVSKFYPQADGPHDVDFSTGFGQGKSDWKQIKNYHNVKFRQPMLDSPYNLVWTAMATDDYEAQIENDDRTAKKPEGEKNNVYKVDEVVRLREGSDGAPVAVLQKSGKIKHRYAGLRYPTFADHRELVEALDDAEAGRGSPAGVADRFDVQIVEGNPAYLDANE